MVTNPRKHYRRTDKFMRGVEKVGKLFHANIHVSDETISLKYYTQLGKLA